MSLLVILVLKTNYSTYAYHICTRNYGGYIRFFLQLVKFDSISYVTLTVYL